MLVSIINKFPLILLWLLFQLIMACSPSCKQGTVFSVGTLMLLGGVLAGLFWSDVADYIYKTVSMHSASCIRRIRVM